MNELPKGVREKGQFFYIEFQLNKKRHYESTKLKSRNKSGDLNQQNVALAVRQRRSRIESIKYGIEPEEFQSDFKTGTFANVAQDYLNTLELKASTRTSYKQILQKYWMPHLDNRQVSAVELPRLRAISREINWPSHKVQKNATSVIRQVFEFAQNEGYRDDNPAQKLKISRYKTQPSEPDPYLPEERNLLLAWLSENYKESAYIYFLAAFYTGMRTGELLALEWSDYDGKSFLVDKALVRGDLTTTKTSQGRQVALPAILQRAINSLPSRFKKGAMFINQYGREYKSGYHLNKKFREAHIGTGVRHRTGPYPWRHTYASIGLTSGADPIWLSKQLGHSVQVFYSVYARWIDNEDKDNAELAKIG